MGVGGGGTHRERTDASQARVGPVQRKSTRCLGLITVPVTVHGSGRSKEQHKEQRMAHGVDTRGRFACSAPCKGQGSWAIPTRLLPLPLLPLLLL
jgi:hypothetical protein